MAFSPRGPTLLGLGDGAHRVRLDFAETKRQQFSNSPASRAPRASPNGWRSAASRSMMQGGGCQGINPSASI
jgi:hypothetical protein